MPSPRTLVALAALCLPPSLALAADGFYRWFSDPPELHLGPVGFHPRLTTGMLYDDNFTISSSNPLADEIWSVSPAFQLIAGDRTYRAEGFNPLTMTGGSLVTSDSSRWPSPIVTLDYGPQVQWYTHYSNNDCVNQFGTFNAIYPMARLILGLQQVCSYANTQVIEAGQLTRQTVFNTAVTSGYVVSDRTSFEMNFRRNSYAYPDSRYLTSYAEYINDDLFHYQVSELLNLGVGPTFGYVAIQDQPVSNLRAASDQTYQQLLGNAIYRLTEKVNVNGSLGVEFRQYANGAAGTIKPVLRLSGSYRPWLATTFSLGANSGSQPSINQGYNYNLTSVFLGISQRLLDRFTVNLSGSYGYYSYYTVQDRGQLAADRQNNSNLTARLGLTYQFNPFFRVDAFYNYMRTSYVTLTSSDYDDNRIGLSATYGF